MVVDMPLIVILIGIVSGVLIAIAMHRSTMHIDWCDTKGEYHLRKISCWEKIQWLRGKIDFERGERISRKN